MYDAAITTPYWVIRVIGCMQTGPRSGGGNRRHQASPHAHRSVTFETPIACARRSVAVETHLERRREHLTESCAWTVRGMSLSLLEALTHVQW